MSVKLFPKHRVESVLELTPDLLAEWRLASLLLDVDSTLKRYSETDVSSEIQKWLESLKDFGFFLCLLSNGKEGRIARFAQRVGLPYIALAMKPFPHGCRKAVKTFQLRPEKTAMVGDQVFADVLAGNLAGLTTILVTPIHPEEEPWFTRLKRPLEKFVLRFDRRTRSEKEVQP